MIIEIFKVFPRAGYYFQPSNKYDIKLLLLINFFFIQYNYRYIQSNCISSSNRRSNIYYKPHGAKTGRYFQMPLRFTRVINYFITAYFTKSLLFAWKAVFILVCHTEQARCNSPLRDRYKHELFASFFFCYKFKYTPPTYLLLLWFPSLPSVRITQLIITIRFLFCLFTPNAVSG